MCGRYTLTADLEKVADRFGAPLPPASATYNPRFNIAPTQAVIVVGDDGKRYMKEMLWGLIPSWAKDPGIGNRMINARAETLAEKPAFRAALKKRRCIIPADGFYEWQKLSGGKQPLRIVLKSREPFGFAGLWERWLSPEGEEVLSCTIVTTEANELLKPVHERMPVILTRDAETAWLDPKTQDPEKLLPLLRQYPSDEMEFYPVSREVNSPAVDKPSNIQPIKETV
ncbi:MAG: SOS response-associated peptidase [Verrucomicrobiia bacterium]|jgi:putative SOS response-associated peptidase YedK